MLGGRGRDNWEIRGLRVCIRLDVIVIQDWQTTVALTMNRNGWMDAIDELGRMEACLLSIYAFSTFEIKPT